MHHVHSTKAMKMLAKSCNVTLLSQHALGGWHIQVYCHVPIWPICLLSYACICWHTLAYARGRKPEADLLKESGGPQGQSSTFEIV